MKRCNVIWIVIVTFVTVMQMLPVIPADAGQVSAVVLDKLRSSPKLHIPDAILEDFMNGQAETAVIVILQPSVSARALAAQSIKSARVPAEFASFGAPTYYDLQNDSVKSQLRATVADTVSRVIDQSDATGITVTHRFSYQFGFAAKVTPDALIRLINTANVLTVEKDVILQAHLAQGIPLMNASAVRSTYTGSGMSIAICDTGIDTSHPRLGGGGFPNAKVIGGYNTGDNTDDPRPDSINGVAHGTACAGIAAGSTGIVGDYIGGVAPDAKLYSVKISTGTTGNATTAAMIAGWEWAVTHKNDDVNNPIMVISTSFGGGQYTSACDAVSSGMTTAAANAVAAGITVFASSGNDGFCDSIAWPACISYVNSVGAVYDANIGTYNPCVSSASCALKTSTTGCATGWYVSESTSPDKVTAYSNSAPFLTLFAPSNSAYTTDIVGAGGYSTGDYYSSFGGTSAACPYAAGSAAVLQQAAKVRTGSYLTPAQVRSYLVNNGDNVTDSKVAVTRPRINLGNAVNDLPTGTDFMISVLPLSITVSPGWASNATVTTTVSGGFSSAVTLTTTGLPAGVTASFNPMTIGVPGSGSSILTLTAASNATVGTFSISIAGSGGGKTHTAMVTLTVSPNDSNVRSITTTFVGGYNQSGNMFDVTALQYPLTITKFDLNLPDTAGTTGIPVNVYYKSGSYVGSETSQSDWVLLNSSAVTSVGPGNPTPLAVSSLTIPAGQTYGLYITRTDGAFLNYMTGSNTYSDAYIQLTLGAATTYPLGTIFTPRTWNGTVYYTSMTVPAAPTITTAVTGNLSAKIYISPGSNGGSAITGYTVTSNAGTTTPTLVLPIIVTGLANGSSYTFIANEINSIGTSSASPASNIIIPGVVRNYGYEETGYQSLQAAYNANTPTTEYQIKAGAQVGGLVKSNANSVTVKGGYDDTFTYSNGLPSVLGNVQLNNGVTIFQNVIIH